MVGCKLKFGKMIVRKIHFGWRPLLIIDQIPIFKRTKSINSLLGHKSGDYKLNGMTMQVVFKTYKTSTGYWDTTGHFRGVNKNPSHLTKVENLKKSSKMNYFVIGVSGITCGGKTSLTTLLKRAFPWARVMHQDHYFRDDDWPGHIRVPESENHVNYEVFNSLDMEKMYRDVKEILDSPPVFMTSSTPPALQSNDTGGVGDKAEVPNFDEKFLQHVRDIEMDLSKYKKVPILILEGFTIFGSQFLFDKCDARFFFSMDKERCRIRRSQRSYVPPDSANYFDAVIWPEYEDHFNNFIKNRKGLIVFDGNMSIDDSLMASVQVSICRMVEKYGELLAQTSDVTA